MQPSPINTAPIPLTTPYQCRRCHRWGTLATFCECQPRRWRRWRRWRRPVERRSFAYGGIVFAMLYALAKVILGTCC